MNVNDVIKYPILTEKSYNQMSDNIYTFAVDRRTNKVEVRKAVEFIFDVKVASVNILTVAAKPKRLGRFAGYTNKYKKALVYLQDGYSINFFPEESKAEEKEETAVQTEVAENKKDAKAVEAKVAEKLAKKAAK
ncbi:50S ribosomal protein L23 [Mycoplasma sp. 4044]